MNVKYRIGSVILCDDARVEIMGKETLIGVYNGVLVVQTVPHAMQKLCFRLPISIPGKINGKAIFQIIGPEQQKLVEVTGDVALDPSDPGYELPFGLAVGNFVLPSFGQYDVRFVIGDGKPRSVTKFLVRMPRHGEHGYVAPTAPVAAKSSPKKSKPAKSKGPRK
nr:hypothetical protein [uncultured Dongia sp.]